MNIKILNKNNNRKLIVFFTGWSFDENPFAHLSFGEYDVIMVYDYSELSFNLDIEKLIENYDEKYLLSWSMGVYVSYLFGDLFKDFNLRLAINGTPAPVDDKYGIPVKIFELTLKHAKRGLEGKFYQNIFYTEQEYERYLKNPVQRDIDNRVAELENLYSNIKSSAAAYGQFHDRALVSVYDKIIPPQNQIAFYEKNNIPVVKLNYGHSPFYNFNSWEEIIQCR